MADFNIPTDTYSWSGLPKQSRDSLLASVMPNLQQSVAEYPGMVSGYVAPKMRQFKNVATQAGQGLLNNLATRNVLGSQVAGDQTVQLMKELNKDNLGQLADMDFQAKLAYPSLLGSLVELARGTEAPFEPYQAMLNFLTQNA